MDSLLKKVDPLSSRILRFVVNANKTGKDSRTKGWLTARMQLLETYWNNYLENHNALLETADAKVFTDNLYFKNDVYSDIECAYIDAKAWVEDQLNLLSIAHETVAEVLTSTQIATTPRPSQINLPKIDLPKFNGTYMEWPSFRDKYTALIHNSEYLSNVEKMHYLKTSVIGEASKLIENFSSTDVNYDSAWDVLVQRYDNLRILVSTYLHSLVSLTPMSCDSASELRRVLDTFNQSVSSLKNLERPVDSWDDWLVYFLSNKLENSLRKDWENSVSTSRSTPAYQILYNFLNNRLQALNAVKQTQPLQKRPSLSQPNSHSTKITSKIHHASSLKCYTCQKDHFLFACPKFKTKTVDERIKLVRAKHLCFNCLKSNHDSSSCPSNSRCKQCNRNHHTLLHRQVEPLASTSSSSDSAVITSNVASLPSTTPSLMASNPVKFTTKLLATAIVNVEARATSLRVFLTN